MFRHSPLSSTHLLKTQSCPTKQIKAKRSSSQTWLHFRITWGPSQMPFAQGHTPEQSKQDLWGWDSDIRIYIYIYIYIFFFFYSSPRASNGPARLSSAALEHSVHSNLVVTETMTSCVSTVASIKSLNSWLIPNNPGQAWRCSECT